VGFAPIRCGSVPRLRLGDRGLSNGLQSADRRVSNGERTRCRHLAGGEPNNPHKRCAHRAYPAARLSSSPPRSPSAALAFPPSCPARAAQSPDNRSTWHFSRGRPPGSKARWSGVKGETSWPSATSMTSPLRCPPYHAYPTCRVFGLPGVMLDSSGRHYRCGDDRDPDHCNFPICSCGAAARQTVFRGEPLPSHDRGGAATGALGAGKKGSLDDHLQPATPAEGMRQLKAWYAEPGLAGDVPDPH